MGAESRKTQIQSPFASEKSDMEGICLFVYGCYLYGFFFLFGWLVVIYLFIFFSGFKYTVLKLSLHVYVLKFLV